MKRAMKGLAGAAVVASVVAACAGSGGVYSVGPESAGFRMEFDRLAGSGTIPTTVIGNPFAVEKPAFDAAVADAVHGQYIGPEATFDTKTGPETLVGGRIVFWFDPKFDPSIHKICADPATLGHAPEPGRVAVAMALCVGSTSKVQFAGTLDGVTGPTDKRFRQMLADTTWSLSSTRDPMMDSDQCTGSNC